MAKHIAATGTALPSGEEENPMPRSSEKYSSDPRRMSKSPTSTMDIRGKGLEK